MNNATGVTIRAGTAKMTLKILAHNVFKFHVLRRPNHIMFRLESGINFSGAAHGITLYIDGALVISILYNFLKCSSWLS